MHLHNSSRILFSALKALCVWYADDLTLRKMLKVNIGICRQKGGRAYSKAIGDAVERIPCPDHIAAGVFPAAVERNENAASRFEAFRIESRIVSQDALHADVEFPSYSAQRITSRD